MINIFVALYCHRDTDDSLRPVQFPCSHLWLSPTFSTSNCSLSLSPKSSFVVETFLLHPEEWETASLFPKSCQCHNKGNNFPALEIAPLHLITLITEMEVMHSCPLKMLFLLSLRSFTQKELENNPYSAGNGFGNKPDSLAPGIRCYWNDEEGENMGREGRRNQFVFLIASHF